MLNILKIGKKNNCILAQFGRPRPGGAKALLLRIHNSLSGNNMIFLGSRHG